MISQPTRCPHCGKVYKTARGMAAHLEKFRTDAAAIGAPGCRCCGCEMGDHNDPRQGGGCTNCGDCEGWL